MNLKAFIMYLMIEWKLFFKKYTPHSFGYVWVCRSGKGIEIISKYVYELHTNLFKILLIMKITNNHTMF